MMKIIVIMMMSLFNGTMGMPGKVWKAQVKEIKRRFNAYVLVSHENDRLVPDNGLEGQSSGNAY